MQNITLPSHSPPPLSFFFLVHITTSDIHLCFAYSLPFLTPYWDASCVGTEVLSALFTAISPVPRKVLAKWVLHKCLEVRML